jgi:CRP-like cAMP-binding protein
MDIRNRLLAACGEAAMASLAPHISEVSLTVGRIIAEPGDPVEHVYFPTSGVVSIVTIMEDGRSVESLTVGREGAVGLLAAFGDTKSVSRAIIQIPGAAQRIRADHLREAAARDPSIMSVVVRYAQAVEAQLHQAAACNALHHIEARLCRWLLTCEDRTGDSVLPLTHEFLALMLGAQRTSVTLAAQAVKRRGLITYRRGVITMLDRVGVENASCECYQATEDVYDRIFARVGANSSGTTLDA